MGNFFSTDGPLFEGMAYIINIIYVSVLWILFFNTDHYHRRIIDGTVLYGDEGDPSWTQLYIQGVLAEF